MAFEAESYAKLILGEFQIKTDMASGHVYIYDKKYGYYNHVFSEQLLQKKIQEELAEESNDYKVNNVLNYIKRETYEDLSLYDGNELVCVNDGILDLKAMAPKQHDPSLFVRYRIPAWVELSTEEDMEAWLSYVRRIVRPEDELKLQESAGNILANHSIAKKAFYFYGRQDSGKSTYLQIIQNFLSPNNYSNLSLQQLQEKFTNHTLYGKRANIYADTPYQLVHRDFGIIKCITGGDDITLQQKNKPAFQCKINAKLFFSGNGVPYVDLDTVDDVFIKRWEFIEFPNSFPLDDGIIAKYSTDNIKSAILRWALKGFIRLRENKWKFTNATTYDDAKNLFDNAIPETDPFPSWLCKNFFPSSSDSYVLPKDLHESYKDYCIDHGKLIIYKTPETLCKRLHNEHHCGFNTEPDRQTIDGEQVYVIAKIKKKESG